MKERSGNTPGDAGEIALGCEDFHERRLRELRKVCLSAVAETAKRHVVACNRWHLRQQTSRVNAAFFKRVEISGQWRQFFKRVGIGESEHSRLRASQAAEMCAALEILTEFVRDGTNVAAGADTHIEKSFLAVYGCNDKRPYENLCRLEFDGLSCASEFVGRSTGDFLC